MWRGSSGSLRRARGGGVGVAEVAGGERGGGSVGVVVQASRGGGGVGDIG